jgi:hypothetical protein
MNSMPLLSSYNHFACIQIDILIQPEICNSESKEGIHHNVKGTTKNLSP